MKKDKNLWDDPLSVLFWWYDLAIFALMFPSNSILVFLRTHLGYRLMKPWVMGLIFLFLSFGASMGFAASSVDRPSFGEPSATAATTTTGMPLLIFTLGMGALAIYHRRRAWEGVFDKANPLHTMARGDSYLYMVTKKIAPRLSEFHVQRYIEPILVGLLGAALIRVMPAAAPLGMWLIVSAFSLAAIEALVMEKAINDMLDRHDATIEATMIEQIDQVKQTRNAEPVLPPKSGGVTISPELARLRAERLGAAEAAQAVVADPGPRRPIATYTPERDGQAQENVQTLR